MAFEVEDGTGVDGAVRYITVSYADSYFNIRGVTEWASLTNKEALLIRATDYIDTHYCCNFVGEPLTTTQSLAFPRVVDGLTIYPEELKKAVCELALKSPSITLIPDVERKTTKEKIDVIEIEYDPNAPESTKYIQIDNLMSRYLINSSSSNSTVSRR